MGSGQDLGQSPGHHTCPATIISYIGKGRASATVFSSRYPPLLALSIWRSAFWRSTHPSHIRISVWNPRVLNGEKYSEGFVNLCRKLDLSSSSTALLMPRLPSVYGLSIPMIHF